jgi:hypothetical protein
MRNQALMLLCCCALLVFAFACGGKYDDAVDVQEDFINLAADYVKEMDTADSAEKVAAAMNHYADGMAELAPRIREINEKYPELRDPETVPEKLKSTTEEQKEVMRNVSSSFMKAMPYMQDPEVQAAQKRIAQAMQGVNKK